MSSVRRAFFFEFIFAFFAAYVSKKGTFFCPFDEIEDLSSRIFSRLHDYNLFAKLERKDFLSEIVDFYCVTNKLHPFREGNGRAQLFESLIQDGRFL